MAATDNLVDFAESFFKAKSSDELSEAWKLILGIYDVSVSRGKMFVPETFYPKIQKWFGHIDDRSVEDAVIRAENQLVGMFCCKFCFFHFFPRIIVFLTFSNFLESYLFIFRSFLLWCLFVFFRRKP